jgi:hypothetical protein
MREILADEEGLGGANQEICRRRFSFGGKDYTGDGQCEPKVGEHA